MEQTLWLLLSTFLSLNLITVQKTINSSVLEINYTPIKSLSFIEP